MFQPLNRPRNLILYTWMILSFSACFEDEKTRPYDEFLQDYHALLDMDQVTTQDMSPDAAPALDMPADLTIMEDMPEDMSFMLDPENPPECSVQGGPSTTVTFINATNKRIDLYWYTPQCVPIKYTTIDVDGLHEQQTFVGHVWVYAPEFAIPANVEQFRAVVFDDTSEITFMEGE